MVQNKNSNGRSASMPKDQRNSKQSDTNNNGNVILEENSQHSSDSE